MLGCHSRRRWRCCRSRRHVLFLSTTAALSVIIHPGVCDALATATGAGTTRSTSSGTQSYEIQDLSTSNPKMLLIRNFVSPSQRHSLIWSTRNHPETKDTIQYTTQSHGGGDDDGGDGGSLSYGQVQKNRHGSNVYWMPHSKDPIGKSLAKSTSNLLQELHNYWDDKDSNQHGDPTPVPTLHEELQVVQYKPDGEFRLHHDGQERMITVLYYLNGIAGTWFPLASPSLQESSPPPPINNKEAHEKATNLQPGHDGILVATATTTPDKKNDAVIYIQPGDALVFYNYSYKQQEQDDTNGNLKPSSTPSSPFELKQDWSALHAGLPATKEKWIATHWFHYK